jgi:hypothetical protein
MIATLTALDGVRPFLVRWSQFTAWENFYSPIVLGRWLLALAATSVIAAAAWSAGALVVGARARFRSAAEESVVNVAVGLALFATALFLMALVGGYRPSVLLVIVVAPIVLLSARRNRADATRPWRSLAGAVRAAPVAVAFAAVCAIPAQLPSIQWDESMFHLAYPQQWIAAGHLTVDPFAWYPYYTWNWELLQGGALMTPLGTTLVHMLGWLATGLAATTIAVMLRRLDVPRGPSLVAALAYFVMPPTVALLDTGMIDTPIALFLSVVVLLFLMLRDDSGDRRLIAAAACCTGMFMGLKITSLAYVPLFVGLALVRLRGRALARYLVLAAILSAPWFAYNLVRSGDPAPPVIGHVLGRHSPLWNEEDLALHAQLLSSDGKGPVAFLRSAPLLLNRSAPTGLGVLGDGPMLWFVLAFPFTLLLGRPLWRERRIEPLAAAWYGIAFFVVATFQSARYAHAVPLAIVCATVLVVRVARRTRPVIGPRALTWVTAAVVIGPTPWAIRPTRALFSFPVPRDAQAETALSEALYPALHSLAILRNIAPSPARVYVTQPGFVSYYQAAGYRRVGTATHPGRFPDLRRAFAADSAARFVRGQGADYLVIDKKYSTGIGAVGVANDVMMAALTREGTARLVYNDSLRAIYDVRAARGNERPALPGSFGLPRQTGSKASPNVISPIE